MYTYESRDGLHMVTDYSHIGHIWVKDGLRMSHRIGYRCVTDESNMGHRLGYR